MNGAARSERVLRISEALGREIQAIRSALGLVGATELSIERVEYHEALLGATLSDSILAIFVGLERDLEEIRALTEEARERESLPSRYLAIDHGEARSGYWCVPRCPMNEKGPLLRYSRARGLECGLPLTLFLRSLYVEQASPLANARRASGRFEATLFGAPKRIRRRIFHHQFGYGEVRRVIDGPRRALEIDFDESGIRRVLEEYIESL